MVQSSFVSTGGGNMRAPLLTPSLLLFALSAVAQGPNGPATAGSPTCERDIRPLLARQCAGCHTRTQVSNVSISGGLALDDFAAVTAGTKTPAGNTTVIVAGK